MKESSFSSGQKYWDAKIAEQRSSGLSQAEFCRSRGISVTAFYSWLSKSKKLRPRKDLVRLEVSENSEPLRVVFQNGVALHFSKTPDPEWLMLLMKLVS